MRYSITFAAILGFFVCAAAARADDWPESCLPPEETPAAIEWDSGTWSIQFVSGYYPMSPLGPKNYFRWPDARVNYLPQALRVGYECPVTFLTGTWFEGTYQGLIEYNVSPITRDFGGFFSGPSGILRYNYRREDSWLVPYVQTGAGLVLNDAYHEQRQRLIGEAVEFLLRIECGMHVLLTNNFSLDVEGGWQHVSNACLASRNGGINNLGVSVGFTYQFGRK